MRVLYVEDEKYLADAVVHLLKQSGIEVDWVDNGLEGLRRSKSEVYDAVVLDIMLPELSGVEILSKMRAAKINTPVIMLSALSQVEDKVACLDKGADDYLAKPFKTSELIARLRAITRRPPLTDRKKIAYKDLEYDIAERKLGKVALTKKEAALLECLLKTPGKIHAKEQLVSYVWGAESDSVSNNLEVYVSYLRRKFEIAGIKEARIENIRDLGYKIV